MHRGVIKHAQRLKHAQRGRGASAVPCCSQRTAGAVPSAAAGWAGGQAMGVGHVLALVSSVLAPDTDSSQMQNKEEPSLEVISAHSYFGK